MKPILITLLLIMFNANLFAKEMTYTDITSDYNKSYEHERQNKYKEAIDDLRNIHANYPDTYTVNFRMGWLYYLNKNYANSIENLQKALSISPASIEVLNTIVLVYAAKGEWNKVEEQSVKALKIDYYNITANSWYSHALKMQGKYDLAIKVDQKMLAVYPTSILFLQELGINLFLNKQKEESKAVLSNLKILNPSNEIADYYLKQ
ncbi:MAG: tetratricopeptide repeat protein [Desulfobacterales bacterium]|nr:tetratricopeptide repeat protein [Desulfobacterales bacterium]